MQTGNPAKQKNQCSEKERALIVERKKKCTLKDNQPCLLCSGIGPGWYHQMQGGLDDESKVSWVMDVRWSGFVSPAGGNQRVIWRPVYVQVLMRDWKVQKFTFSGARTRIEFFPQVSTFTMLIIIAA